MFTHSTLHCWGPTKVCENVFLYVKKASTSFWWAKPFFRKKKFVFFAAKKIETGSVWYSTDGSRKCSLNVDVNTILS